ncbi:MAG: hypothetical protein RIQ89_715 [Bacteroidota bacterium]|jgi:uncharacterized protein
MAVFNELSPLAIAFLSLIAFIAGFVESAAGGGGIIQLPALLIQLPNLPFTTILGTNKIAGFSGTLVSAYQYSKSVKFDFMLLVVVIIVAAIAAYVGASMVSTIAPEKLKPLVLILLILISLFTFFKKDLGTVTINTPSRSARILWGIVLGICIGFYDGFLGPGTGTFLVFGFVLLLGFEFLVASAYAKVINCITNMATLFVFVSKGSYVFFIAFIMAFFNMLGNYIGSKVTMAKGNGFVRSVFMIMVLLMIIKYTCDVFK